MSSEKRLFSKNQLKTFRSKIRYRKYFAKFKKYGKNIWLSKGGLISRPEEITLGNNIFLSENFHISARNLVFGDNILVGPNLQIVCDNHIFQEVGKTMFETRKTRDIGSVTIENDVWIGGNVVILKDVTIREGSIVGAGSVVTRPLPPYCICHGNPCKPVKRRFETEDLKRHLEIIGSKYSLEDIETIFSKISFA